MNVLVGDLKFQNTLKYLNTHQPVNMNCFGTQVLSCQTYLTISPATTPHPQIRQTPISPAIKPTSFHPIHPSSEQHQSAQISRVSHPWDPSSATATTTTTHPPTPTPPTPTRCVVIKDWHGPANALWITCLPQLTVLADGAWLQAWERQEWGWVRAPRAVCLAPCIYLRMGWSSWRGEGRLYEGGREGAGRRRGEGEECGGEECGGEEGGRRKKREQEKRKKLQEGPPWVGFSPKKVLPPEKAIPCRDPLGWLHHCLVF
ncbi:hypothetical protein V2W45_1347877 [Cenococcum geophilum]